MSREVPLLASEKIRLGCLIFFILAIGIPAIFGAWQKLYRIVVRDKDGYEKAMVQIGEHYHFEVMDFDDSINRYNLKVDPRAWRAYDEDQRFEYCDAVFGSIRRSQTKYRMKSEDDKPRLVFFVNAVEVANVDNGLITVKKEAPGLFDQIVDEVWDMYDDLYKDIYDNWSELVEP